MSKNRGPVVKYLCSTDCRQMGCPGHAVQVIHDLSTDMYIFEFGDGEREVFDENKFHAMEESLEGLR